MKYLIANWKMNQTIGPALDFLRIFFSLRPKQGSVCVMIAPPFTALNSLATLINSKNGPVSLCAQNMSQYDSGAYTGEISAEMIIDAGCKYVILGHSERRHLFFETNETIAQKYHQAIKNNLVPILCFGETLPVYNAKETINFIKNQLLLFQGTNPPIFAYEPVWAIGSGLIPKINEISDVVNLVKSSFPSSSILYGGSVNPESILKIADIPNLDGFLVGGASLKAETFFLLLQALEKVNEPL